MHSTYSKSWPIPLLNSQYNSKINEQNYFSIYYCNRICTIVMFHAKAKYIYVYIITYICKRLLKSVTKSTVYVWINANIAFSSQTWTFFKLVTGQYVSSSHRNAWGMTENI